MTDITVDIKKKNIGISSNLVAIGKGWMSPSVYDPQWIVDDVFDMDNMVDWEEKHYVTDEQIETWDAKQDALTAGENVNIDENNVISAVDTTYTAGDWISIDSNNVISNTRVSAEWWNIVWDITAQTDLQQSLWEKQDVLTAWENIDITNNVISATDTIPNNAKLTIQKNWTKVGDFTADASENKTINITVPVKASDINALPNTTKYWANISMSINPNTYVITLNLKDQNGSNLWSTQTIDLPLESVVVSGSYDSQTKEVVLVLENGSEIRFSVADLVSGLQTEITANNKLSSDLVDDTNKTHKFVTTSDKNKWNAKADICDIPTDNCQLANSCGYTTCTGTLVQSDIQNLAQCCDIPTDNCQLTNGCGYQFGCNMVCDLTDADHDHYPTAKAVSDAISQIPWTWDMSKAVYDPCWCEGDAFDYCNFHNTPTIPTDNCELLNWCWYTTCTWTLVASDIENLAQCCDIPTDNCQLANSCWYTTCTWTLVQSDIQSLAQCCDIPTDNCQLANSCGYTTCTWTLVASDIQNLAQCCDIPTDNCQLSNGCWYTTCTGTLIPSDLNCYAKCADIPTNNCQLTNGCWYITWINCSDVTTALWFTPYNCNNPAGYTTCTWTLVQCDIQNLAKCCDIPTDNCQLANGCDYATCCYVNDSINSVTAYYITKDAQWNQFATYAELSAATTFYSGWVARVPTRNDYTIVLADENHSNATTRYIYQNSQWEFQYIVNETALTQAQLDALNSWITCSKVSCYDWVVSTVSWYWNIVSCNACDFATPSDIPTDNCQLANGCGYTTCTWTLVPSDLCCYAKCSDIPTNNCQLTNWCWYITGIDCSDVTTALWYTPYNCNNPAWYTTCTWTLVASDIQNLAQCCDIPTDNCQLANGCWFTTCTGTLVASDLNDYALSCDVLTKTNTTSYTPTADYHPATKKYVDNNGGKTYIAGTWISIPNNTDYSAVKWPCPNWYHIPSREENAAIVDAMTALGINTANWACMKTYLKMPYAWFRNQSSGAATAQWTGWRYWSYLRLNVNTASVLSFQSNTNGNSNANAAYGMSIRPFKNDAVIPDNTWTTLFDWSSIATGAWIFHNTTDGIISISADGTNWITIADKNLWATVVYNDWDTLSESNAGWYFQHWNNYMFPFTWSVTTSSTKVDATDYWPWNYYSSSTFIAVTGDWSSVYNSNLWWGDTWVITVNNVIYNTGVLSVNGQTWDVTIQTGTDYSWVTKTISSWQLELWLRTIVNVPTSNFTLTAPATIKDWEEYVIRVISETSYTMTLGTWFTNPRNVDTTLSGYATDQYAFLAIWGELELQPLVATWS